MSHNVARTSVDSLISDIRELYHKTKSSSHMSCDLVDEKLASRAAAQETELAEAAVMASRHFEEKFKRRSFYERMMARSMTVNASSCDRRCTSHISDSCSCGRTKSVSRRNLNQRKAKSTGIFAYGSIPQVLNAPRKLIKHAIGEIVLQLEKRIILHVYPDSEQVYYGPLEDIREVIMSEPDRNMRVKRLQALDCRIQRLQPLGWDMQYHVSFGNRMMQRYGVGAPAWFYDEPDPLVTHAQLARIVTKKLPLDERLNMITILSCLLSLALEDGRPLFLTCDGEEFKTMGK